MKKQNAKRTLLMSFLSLLVCVSMLVGTTFAWFTDSVTSANNIIKSGNLDVEMYWAEGSQPVPTEDSGWTDASEGAIFNYTLWEPGYTQVRHIKIANEGTLALKYQVLIKMNGEIVDSDGVKLSDVIDVYYVDPAVQVTDRTALANAPMLGTLTDVLAAVNSSASGTLEAGCTDTITIAFKMQESAGNDYMNKSIGTDFSVVLMATQLTSESDSFDDQYDFDANYVTSAKTLNDFFDAIETGSDVQLEETLKIDEGFLNALNARFPTTYAVADDTIVIDNNAVIDGNGITVYRTEATKDKPIFQIADGYTLTLSNITVDGGAVWSGEVNEHLLRGTVNTGMTTTGALVAHGKNAHLVLNEGAVLQNNDGANAVNLNTREGSTLTLNGGEIINNHSAAGAIWGGGAITINSGKINGNHGGIGGAIRAVTNVGTLLTMNGGEMNHNMSDGVGGAIWAGSSRSNNVYVLNGGEMAYNYSPSAGGAMYAGYYETVKIGGTFKMHDNVAPTYDAIRFHDHASLVMTGGEVYNQGDNGFFLYNNSASITGGSIAMNFGYNGGLGLTIGAADIDGVISYNLATNHNTAYLAAEFNSFKFTVNESAANFAQFNFKPAAGYNYTEGDEANLICMNEGYSTYWDAATSTFRLMADN